MIQSEGVLGSHLGIWRADGAKVAVAEGDL